MILEEAPEEHPRLVGSERNWLEWTADTGVNKPNKVDNCTREETRKGRGKTTKVQIRS